MHPCICIIVDCVDDACLNTAKDIGKAENDGTIRVRLEVVEGSDSQLHGSSDADVDFSVGFCQIKSC